ncbi:unnamed protein product [Paramecium octaurelia]|uniref:Uncharacterized protein n=1 Tax=Paramecium octaurelia TaxID=43137 RepID=A0A8S1YIU7_PAROT|nr:unnamed protein product [Paramecium octaurelia]
MIILILSCSLVSLLMVPHQHLVVEIRLSDYGMLKQDKKNPKLESHQNFVHSVCFSPDGTTLASDSQNYSILYGMLRQDNKKPNQMVIQVVYKHISSGSDDSSICLWVLRHDNKSWTRRSVTSVIFVCFTSDSAKLAYDSYDNSICLWDVKTTAKELLPQDNFYSEFISQ